MTFPVRGCEAEVFSKLPHDGLEEYTIAAILTLLSAGFKVSIKLEDCRVVDILAVGRKNQVQATKNSLFPVNESSVAIEGENFKSAEVEHGVIATFWHGG